MSNKATNISRVAEKAMASTRRAAEEARAASRALKLAKDSVEAAVAAAQAVERAGTTADAGIEQFSSAQKVALKVAEQAQEAVEWAADAMRAEDEGDVPGAVRAANNASRAAQSAASLWAAAATLAGKSQKEGLDDGLGGLATAVERHRHQTEREQMVQLLKDAIDGSARYLLIRDGRIVATFSDEDDAFLLESELADLDRARGVTSGRCEVIDRRSGHRLGGYLMAGDKALTFLRDERHEARFGRDRHR